MLDREILDKSLIPLDFAPELDFVWITLLIGRCKRAATPEKSSSCPDRREKVQKLILNKINDLRVLWFSQQEPAAGWLFVAPQHGFCA